MYAVCFRFSNSGFVSLVWFVVNILLCVCRGNTAAHSLPDFYKKLWGKFSACGGSGGSAASITNVDSIDLFASESLLGKRGDGGYHTSYGENGGDGQVIIVTTWYE